MKTSFRAWVSLIATATLAFLLIYGFQSWYFPSSTASVFLGVPIVCLGIVIAFWANRKLPIQYNKARLRKPFFLVAMMFFIPIFLWVALGIGIPSLVLKLLGPDDQVTATINLKREGSRYCRREIGLAEHAAFLKDSLCVSPAVFERLSQGQIVSLKVRRSLLGVRVFAIDAR